MYSVLPIYYVKLFVFRFDGSFFGCVFLAFRIGASAFRASGGAVAEKLCFQRRSFFANARPRLFEAKCFYVSSKVLVVENHTDSEGQRRNQNEHGENHPEPRPELVLSCVFAYGNFLEELRTENRKEFTDGIRVFLIQCVGRPYVRRVFPVSIERADSKDNTFEQTSKISLYIFKMFESFEIILCQSLSVMLT